MDVFLFKKIFEVFQKELSDLLWICNPRTILRFNSIDVISPSSDNGGKVEKSWIFIP